MMNLRELPAELFLRSGGPLSRVLFPPADSKSRKLRQAQLAGCTGLFPGYIVFKDGDRCQPRGCCVLPAPTVKTEEDQTELLRWLKVVQGEKEVVYFGDYLEESDPKAPKRKRSKVDSRKKKKKVIYLEKDDPHLLSKRDIILQITTANTTYEIREMFGAKQAMEEFRNIRSRTRKDFKYLCLFYYFPEIPNTKKYALFEYDTVSDKFSTKTQGDWIDYYTENTILWDLTNAVGTYEVKVIVSAWGEEGAHFM